jgi:hypothetical protein
MTFKYTTGFLLALQTSSLCVEPPDLQKPELPQRNVVLAPPKMSFSSAEKGNRVDEAGLDQMFKGRRKAHDKPRNHVDGAQREPREPRKDAKERGEKKEVATGIPNNSTDMKSIKEWTNNTNPFSNTENGMDDLQRFKAEMRKREGLPPVELKVDVKREVKTDVVDDLFTKATVPIEIVGSNRGASRFSKLFKEVDSKPSSPAPSSEPSSTPEKSPASILAASAEFVQKDHDKQQFGRLMQMLQASVRLNPKS